jgi:hypothetical protein
LKNPAVIILELPAYFVLKNRVLEILYGESGISVGKFGLIFSD